MELHIVRAARLRDLMRAPPRPGDDDERPDVARHVVEAGKDAIHEIEIDLPKRQRVDAAGLGPARRCKARVPRRRRDRCQFRQ